MIKPTIPPNDKERVNALEEYSIMDTLPENDFDDITRLASEICETPVSLITFIDPQRQWFKSHRGVSFTETPREFAFCAHAINSPGDMMIIPDSRLDKRFVDNPLVTDPRTHVVFYAGIPLTNPDGFALGTLCIIDNRPRELTERQAQSLRSLSNMVVNLLELRKKNIALEKSKAILEKINQELQQFAYVVSHDIRSPLNNIIALTQILKEDYSKQLDQEGSELLVHLAGSSAKLKDFIDGILSYYRGDTLKLKQTESVDLHQLLRNLQDMLDGKHEFRFTIPPSGTMVMANKTMLEQIFMNLISNAIKYNDKANGTIDIHFEDQPGAYAFSVTDNGAGIEEKHFEKIFQVFETLGKKDRFQNYGTGIGLSTVKKLVERAGGKLTLRSTPGEGTTFSFTLVKNADSKL